MVNRIKYIQYLMIFCILGVIITQGFWLYKDYNYYSGQPLFSSDYDFFYRTPGVTVVPRQALPAEPLTVSLNTPGVPAIPAQNIATVLPTIVAYPSSRPLGVTSLAKMPSGEASTNSTINPYKRVTKKDVAGVPAIPAQRIATTLPSLVAYPSSQPLVATTMATLVPADVPAGIDAYNFKPVTYKAPLSYVLQKMKLQFGVSILLILFTTTCFIFMSVTIFNQRKLSVAKNNFINSMTHELKTPLATVSVAVEAMRDFGAWEDQKKAQLYLNISKNEIDHLSRLIEFILQQSIFESHKMEISLKNTDVNKLIKEIMQNYSLSNQQVNIEQHYTDDIPAIPIDPVHMSNVIRNLVDNAIKYSKVQKNISISSDFQNRNWIVTVADNGIGIPKIYQKDVFERFFRVPTAEVEAIKGFGLGLSYCRQVVTLHKGSISLQSIENKGTVFTICIPVQQEATA